MPIYEYYCKPCHTIYSFYARTNAEKQPPRCPKCKAKKLEKQISRFAISKGLSEPTGGDDDPFANVDESKMEELMMEMAETFGDEEEGGAPGSDDPHKMAALMRKMFKATGVEPNSAMQEAIRRMEAGEDPDKIDEDLGSVLDEEDPFSPDKGKGIRARMRRLLDRPNVDPELYDYED